MTTASGQDGAFAWLLCVMSFLNLVIIGGFVYATGMFYLMFKGSLNATDSEAALIISFNNGAMHLICPLVGILCARFGSRRVGVAGAIISTAGLAGSAFSTHIFHLYITFGIIAGAGQGVINIITITVLDPYFHKYKRLACSIALSGYGVGSFIVPPVLKLLEDRYGWRGAILLLAGINAHMMVTCSLYRPFEPAPEQKQSAQPQDSIKLGNVEKTIENGFSVELKVPHANTNPAPANSLKVKALEICTLFKVIPFFYMCICRMIFIFAISMLLTHFGSYLLTMHFTSMDVVNLYVTLGVTATIARPLAGLVVEIFPTNMAMLIMLTILLSGMLTIVLPFMKRLWMMYMYAVVYQLLTGPYFGLGATTVMENVPKSQVATAYGLFIFSGIPGLVLGAPTGVWMYEYTQVYAHTFYLAGTLMVLAALSIAPTAYHIHKKRRAGES